MSGAIQNKSTTTVSRHRDKQPYANNNNRNKSSLSFAAAAPTREIQPQHQNWLMKFLRIKPAVTVLAFQVSRVRARKEIVHVLREWKRYGMRDIMVDKAAGRVWCRVGVKNCKLQLFLLHYPSSLDFFRSGAATELCWICSAQHSPRLARCGDLHRARTRAEGKHGARALHAGKGRQEFIREGRKRYGGGFGR